ncbi:MAG: VCBS repeat-containing protein [Saprospiraceae bacterium]|nr:VCBS repeat-containing protein [Saprospiraceae bacterium]
MNLQSPIRLLPFAATATLLLILVFANCKKAPHPGEALARQYCSGCHLFPEPGLLPKHVWEKDVLPIMSGYLGRQEGKRKLMPTVSREEFSTIGRSGIFPNQPVVNDAEWALLVQYFTDNAPTELKSEAPIFKNGLAEKFSIEPVSLPGSPNLSLLEVNKATGQIWCGTQDARIMVLNVDFKIADTLVLDSPVSSLVFENGTETTLTTMGKMAPSDIYKGKLTALKIGSGKSRQHRLEGLNRPVHLLQVDLSGDGQGDWVISEYGNYLGGLQWRETSADGKLGPQKLLRKSAGARLTIPVDFNKDGKMDLVGLFAQGNESIVLFENKGGGEFTERYLLRFPPVYGTSFLELADMNADGHPDLIYSNGDNADYSQVYKPYHGIRIYLNDGKWNFKENTFLPMNGVGMTATRDFDGDGDLDIAATSFFPDSNIHPSEGFVYFENMGGLKFNGLADDATNQGRWLLITTADLDKNGKEEIILGAASDAPRAGNAPSNSAQKAQLLILKMR